MTWYHALGQAMVVGVAIYLIIGILITGYLAIQEKYGPLGGSLYIIITTLLIGLILMTI